MSSSVMLLIKSKARIGVNSSLKGRRREKGREGEKIRGWGWGGSKKGEINMLEEKGRKEKGVCM